MQLKNRKILTLNSVLPGISERSYGMQDLLKLKLKDKHGAEAVELFCYQPQILN